MATIRKRHTLVIRREEHKRDAIGSVFLDVTTDDADIRGCVERYLGSQMKVVTVERHGPVLRAVVECARFDTESQNLVRLGRSMLKKSRRRAAGDMFAEALRLDPINVDALKADASMRIAAGDAATAEERWIRAGEIGGYDGEILRGLANVALATDRRPTAMAYLEEALRVNPDDGDARDLMDELKRQVELRFEEKLAAEKPNEGRDKRP
ncbi:MAG: hypothetical protein QOD06_3423 [Candidatus Binatota bacterium]|jgi:tetratricopeptide (TPR) repeat protein|nr:hypothetical protein [Candidatus Binatota bacterium]